VIALAALAVICCATGWLLLHAASQATP